MPSHAKPDIHKAGVFYACYMLTKFGYAAIETNGTEAHMTGTKDGKTYRFYINAKTEDGASSFYSLDLKFDYLVILTHILEEPNVYILSKKMVYDFLSKRGPDSTGTFWLQIEEYRNKGKYWDEL